MEPEKIGAGQHLREVLGRYKNETTYGRAVAIGVNNLSGNVLLSPQFWLMSGRVDRSPTERFGNQEASASMFTKKGGSARGAVGVLSYDIADSMKRIVIMFSIPYSYGLYENWFNVHVMNRGPTNYDLFWSLYNSQDPHKAKDGILVRQELGFKVSAEMEPDGVAILVATIQKL